MFTRLGDTNKGLIFMVLVVLMALLAALVIRALGITSEFVGAGMYMFTPAEAALIMLLIVTREGFSREGWKTLGLHRLGLSVWWIAFGAPLLVSLATGEGVRFSAPKTARSRRSIRLPELALSSLRKHRKSQLEERMRLTGLWKDHDPVFTTGVGTPISLGAL